MSEQQKKGRLGEVIRFVVTGGVCFLIEQAVLSLLKEIFGLDVNIGTPIAFLVSVVANSVSYTHLTLPTTPYV